MYLSFGLGKKNGGLQIDTPTLTKAALVLRAVNHKLRQKMLQLIHQKTRISVTEIYMKLRLEQSVTSQHLAILRRAEIVNTEREGKRIYCSVNYRRLEKVQQLAGKFINPSTT